MRRIFLVLFYATSLFSASFVLAEEKDFPNKPIEIVVPYDPGGNADICTRIIAKEMSPKLVKVPIIITNIAGAGGMLGVAKVLRSKADGYTLFNAATANMITAPLQSPNPPYDLKDFLPICCYGSTPMIFGVYSTSPFKTIGDVVDYARMNPGKLTCGVTSLGGENHLDFELFKKVAGVNIKIVPYKGTGEAVASLLGKHIDMMVLTYVGFLPYLKAGDARVLATTQKVPGSNLPTIAEAGYPQVNIHMLSGFFLSAKTPKVIYEKHVAFFEKVVKDPDVLKKLENSGILPLFKTSKEFMTELKERWVITSKLLEELGMKKR